LITPSTPNSKEMLLVHMGMFLFVALVIIVIIIVVSVKSRKTADDYVNYTEQSDPPRGAHWPYDANRLLSNSSLRASLGLPSMSRGDALLYSRDGLSDLSNLSDLPAFSNISLEGAIRKVSSGHALTDIFGNPVFVSVGNSDPNQSDMTYMPPTCCGMKSLKYMPESYDV